MKKLLFLMIALVAVVTVVWASKPDDNDKFMTIEADGFHHTLENSGDDCVLLDVRTPTEYKEGHLRGAILIDFKDSKFKENALKQLPKEKTIMVYCRSGRRSAQAAAILADAGYFVFNLEGGITAWKEAGKEIVK